VPVVDPSGISISVIVETRRGTRFPLWMNGAVVGEGASAESLFLDANVGFRDIPIVTSVNIEMSMGYNATCTVELSAPYDLGLALLESELFIIGNTIVTQIGYPRIGLFLPPIATMAVKPSISINPDDGLTATLNGQGGIFAGTRGRRSQQYRNVSVRDVLEEVGNLAHNRWSFVFPDEQPTTGGGPADPLYGERNSISQRNESDWGFVTRLVRQVGCRVVVRPLPNEGARNRVVILRDSETATSDPVYTITSRGQIDMVVPNGRFPLLSFESEAEQVWLSAGSDRVSTNDINHESGDETGRVESTVDDVSDDAPPATDGLVGSGSENTEDVNVAVRVAPEDGDDLHLPVADSDTGRPASEAVQQENREQSERGGGIQATVSTIGNPVAFPGDRIRIENLGLFSGNYEIIGMSHQASEGEWTTTMRLIRRGAVGAEWITEILRRGGTRDAQDQEPADQPVIGEDATGGGATTVEPLDPYSVEGI